LEPNSASSFGIERGGFGSNDIVLLQTMTIDIEGYFTIVRLSKPTASSKVP